MSKQAFIDAMLPYAVDASKRTGIDHRIIIAQAALESGWGRSAPGNNYFGIKSHGKGGGNTLATAEVINGRPVKIKDSFRAYGGMGDSVQGYADFMTQNPRYRKMREAGDLDAQIEALGASGYATDPQYAAKIRSIAYGISGDTPPDRAPPAASDSLPPAEPNLGMPGGTPAPPDRPMLTASTPEGAAMGEEQGFLASIFEGGSDESGGSWIGLLDKVAAFQPPPPDTSALERMEAQRIAWARANGWSV